MPHIIEVQHLFKRFNDLTAVDGISFTVAPGEFFGLLGPNGAGKTTTIRMLYGFSPPTRGIIRVFDMDISRDWRKIKAKIGVCQQDNTLDPDLTVEQNLLVFAGYFSIPARQARTRANELLDFFALSNRRSAKVMDLSGGMIRRLTLARSLINRPELLILDEPTNGMDLSSKSAILDLIARLHEEDKITIVMVSHLLDDVANAVRRIAIVDRDVLMVGSTGDVLTPENLTKIYRRDVRVGTLEGSTVILSGRRRGNL